MIHTGYMDASLLFDERVYAACYEQLPDFRKVKADRLRPGEKKIQSVGVWMLYQSLLRERQLSEELPYNLSHSGNYVLCSV